MSQMLQEREIEHANEYVAALAAHSSYWVEKDLSLFMARQIYLSSLERAVQYAPDDDDFDDDDDAENNDETATPRVVDMGAFDHRHHHHHHPDNDEAVWQPID